MDANGDVDEKPTLILENYMGRGVDFTKVKHHMCASDVESLTLKEMLAMADDECQELWEKMTMEYTESEGEPLLRQEAAKLHGVEVEDVVLAVPQEGIYVAMQVLTKMMKRSSIQFEINIFNI